MKITQINICILKLHDIKEQEGLANLLLSTCHWNISTYRIGQERRFKWKWRKHIKLENYSYVLHLVHTVSQWHSDRAWMVSNLIMHMLMSSNEI